jgi:hypothetical protein
MKLFQTNFVPTSARFIGNAESNNASEAVVSTAEQAGDSADDAKKTESAINMLKANPDAMKDTADQENSAAESFFNDTEGDGEGPSVDNEKFKAFENIGDMSDAAPFDKGISATFRNAFGLKPGQTKTITFGGENYPVSIDATGTNFNINGNIVDWTDPKNIKVLDKSYKIPDDKESLSKALVEFANNNF